MLVPKTPSPQNGSPASVSPAEPSIEEVDHTNTVTSDRFAAAYTELFSPVVAPGNGGTSYQRVTNPLSLEQPTETDAKVNGATKQQVMFAPSPLSDVIAVNGDKYSG